MINSLLITSLLNTCMDYLKILLWM